MTAYDLYTHGPLSLFVRTGPYARTDRYVVEEVQSYELPAFPLRTAIDAGAMIGAFTCWLKHLYPDCAVIAIEPEPGNFALLGKNVEGLAGVSVCQAAFGYGSDKRYLIVDPENSGGHRLVRRNEIPPGQPVVSGEPCLPLEFFVDIFPSVDLLKLDIEGAEMDVLPNAQDDTLRRIRCIVGERHVTPSAFGVVIERLEGLGFVVTDKPHPAFNMADRGLFTACQKESL